jgi:integrase
MPRKRGARVRVAPNLYRDDRGYSVSVCVGTGEQRRSKEKRYPFGTDFADMKRWRDDTRKALRTKMPRTIASGAAGSLKRAIAQYLPTVKAMASLESRTCDLDAWVPAFGHRRRPQITSLELDAQLHQWRANGVAASTCNHRRNALIQLWRTLDGAEAPNPAVHTTHFREPSGEAREIPQDALDELIASMPRSKTRAMYRVVAETGWPPQRVRDLKAEHLHLDDARVFLVGRKKGSGTEGRAYSLTPRAVDALREFVELNAWGGVSKESIYTVFMRAIRRCNRARAAENRPLLPETWRPYDAKHTFGAQAFRLTGDITAVAETMDISEETALRYVRAAVPDRMKILTAAMAQARGPVDGARLGASPPITTQDHTEPK